MYCMYIIHTCILTGKSLVQIIPVFPPRRELAHVQVSLPEVDKVVLRTTDNILTISTESSLDLTAGVQTAFILARQLVVLQIVESDAGIIRSDQQLHTQDVSVMYKYMT